MPYDPTPERLTEYRQLFDAVQKNTDATEDEIPDGFIEAAAYVTAQDLIDANGGGLSDDLRYSLKAANVRHGFDGDGIARIWWTDEGGPVLLVADAIDAELADMFGDA